MVLIISEDKDESTSLVCKWLNFYKINYFRINEDDEYDVKINKNDFVIYNKERSFDCKNVSFFWYRRGTIFLKSFLFSKKSKQFLKQELSIKNHIQDEHSKLEEYMMYRILNNSPKTFGNLIVTGMNKLITFYIAENLGLLTPNFEILTDASHSTELSFETVVKPVSEIPNGRIFDLNYFRILTNKFENQSKIKNTSLLHRQEYIDKDFELRVFYMNKKCFSMAIMSQQDSQTKVDFRNYNIEKPNRRISYFLPKKIESALQKLMNIFKLDSGSIDLLFKNGKYYFLEINPVGQFGMVSAPCNYNIEKKIADLIKESIA